MVDMKLVWEAWYRDRRRLLERGRPPLEIFPKGRREEEGMNLELGGVEIGDVGQGGGVEMVVKLRRWGEDVSNQVLRQTGREDVNPYRLPNGRMARIVRLHLVIEDRRGCRWLRPTWVKGRGVLEERGVVRQDGGPSDQGWQCL